MSACAELFFLILPHPRICPPNTAGMTFNKTLAEVDIEPWFIPFDILLIITSAVSVALLLVFLFIIILNKTCHTIPMMLVTNTCLSQLVFGSDMLVMAVFTFQNDLNRSQYHDSLCIFRGFLGYVVTVLQNYSKYMYFCIVPSQKDFSRLQNW